MILLFDLLLSSRWSSGYASPEHGKTAGFITGRCGDGRFAAVVFVVQVTEPAVLFQQLGLGLVLGDLGLRDPEATLKVGGGLVRLAHALVTLLEVFLESFDGLVPPVDLLLGDGA